MEKKRNLPYVQTKEKLDYMHDVSLYFYIPVVFMHVCNTFCTFANVTTKDRERKYSFSASNSYCEKFIPLFLLYPGWKIQMH